MPEMDRSRYIAVTRESVAVAGEASKRYMGGYAFSRQDAYSLNAFFGTRHLDHDVGASGVDSASLGEHSLQVGHVARINLAAYLSLAVARRFENG